jgi:hypothetical protein
MPGISFTVSFPRLVSFPAEMFNDALFFLEEAKKLDSSSENDWLRWRYLRATIFYSYACLEAYVNCLISDTLRNIYGLNDASKEFQMNRSIRLFNKINIVYPNIIGKSLDKSWATTTHFEVINEIRNRLAHYKGGTAIYNDKDEFGVNLTNAENGIKMVREIVKMLKKLSGEQYPPWIDEVQSKVIR